MLIVLSHISNGYAYAELALIHLAGGCQIDHGIPVQFEGDCCGFIQGLGELRVQFLFAVHVASDLTLEETEPESSGKTTLFSVERALQFCKQMKPLARLSQIGKLKRFFWGHRIVTKCKLVPVFFSSLVEDAVCELSHGSCGLAWNCRYIIELKSCL